VSNAAEADVAVRDEGTIVLLFPRSDPAREWFAENILDGQWLGDGLVVEHRFVLPILQALIDEGFQLTREA
jgi:hypothetical protein